MTGEPLRAVVVDDEPLARDELVFLLGECGGVDVVGEASDAASALALCEAEAPDVAFVDLRMPGPDGLALAEALRGRHPDVSVIVVSAHDDGALRAFEARVLDYLLKPVRLERLRIAVERAKEHRLHPGSGAPQGAGSDRPRGSNPDADESAGSGSDARLERLAVRRRGSWVVVDVDRVIWFEVRDELVWAVTQDDRFALDLTLAALEQRVDPARFFRSHRGVLVRLDRIRAIEPTGPGTFELVLDHPEAPRVPLARERARQLRERIPFAG